MKYLKIALFACFAMLAGPYNNKIIHAWNTIKEISSAPIDFKTMYGLFTETSHDYEEKEKLLEKFYTAAAKKMESFSDLDADTKKAIGLTILNLGRDLDNILFFNGNSERDQRKNMSQVEEDALSAIERITPQLAIELYSPVAIQQRKKEVEDFLSRVIIHDSSLYLDS